AGGFLHHVHRLPARREGGYPPRAVPAAAPALRRRGQGGRRRRPEPAKVRGPRRRVARRNDGVEVFLLPRADPGGGRPLAAVGERLAGFATSLAPADRDRRARLGVPGLDAFPSVALRARDAVSAGAP